MLNNTEEVSDYLSTHKDIVKAKNPQMKEQVLLKEHNKTFLTWFKDKIMKDNNASDTLKWLAEGPKLSVLCYSGQNSEVMVTASSMHFSSSKDKNPILASIPYFGIIDEIWELHYCKFTVPVFKCKWVNSSNSGVQTDELGFTLVDLDKVSYGDEPFIMADQAKQVFFVKDPSNKKWSVVLQGRIMNGNDEDGDSSLEISETPSFTTQMPMFNEEVDVDGVNATRDDHDEGIWEDILV